MLITRKAQAEGLFANVGAGESRVAVRPVRPWTGVSHPLTSDRRVCPTRLAQHPRPPVYKGAFRTPGRATAPSVGRGCSARRRRPRRAVPCHLAGPVVGSALISSRTASILHPGPCRRRDRRFRSPARRPAPRSKGCACDVAPVTCHAKERDGREGRAAARVAGVLGRQAGGARGWQRGTRRRGPRRPSAQRLRRGGTTPGPHAPRAPSRDRGLGRPRRLPGSSGEPARTFRSHSSLRLDFFSFPFSFLLEIFQK